LKQKEEESKSKNEIKAHPANLRSLLFFFDGRNLGEHSEYFTMSHG